MTDTWTWATVTQASPLRIKVDGDTSALDATTDNLVGSLAVDDRVRVHLHSDGIIVTGVQGGNEKVYVIDHPESDPPGAYPEGITMSDTSAGGWPFGLATVVTNAVHVLRTSQVVYEKDGAERQWWRTGLGTTWTAWKEVLTVGQLTEGDIGWTGVTYNSGFRDYHPVLPCEVRKLGGVIYVRGLVARDTNLFRGDTEYSNVATLPAWAKPENSVYTGLGTDTSEAPASGVFADGGAVTVRMGTGTDADWVGTGGISWPAA